MLQLCDDAHRIDGLRFHLLSLQNNPYSLSKTLAEKKAWEMNKVRMRGE